MAKLGLGLGLGAARRALAEARPPLRPREADLARAWEERRVEPRPLVDSRGRVLRVVFPGRRWGGPGPDFRGALIALPDGSLLRGDVEVHTRASGWLAHGHGRDPAYQQVVLHLVLVDDTGTDVTVAGRPIATLVARPAPGLPEPLPVPCLSDLPSLTARLEAAGRARFLGRAARFEGDLAAVEPGQVLWRGLAEGLGFRANTIPFGCLADLVPWSAAWQAAREPDGATTLAALLLGTASLLDGARPEELRAWDALRAAGRGRALIRADAWQRAAIRPANDPSRRCRGLAHLAARWARSADPLELALSALRAPKPAAALEAIVREPPWVGRGRARVLAVNVLLPLLAALGEAAALPLFERFPPEPANRATRYMAEQLGLPASAVRTACHQQGLLHLFKSACAGRWCETCPARGLEHPTSA